jgi:hypothetical protein
MEGRVRRRKQVMDDRNEMTGYCRLKEEAQDGTLWRTRCVRGCGPVVRRTTKLMNILIFVPLDKRHGGSPKPNIFCVICILNIPRIRLVLTELV